MDPAQVAHTFPSKMASSAPLHSHSFHILFLLHNWLPPSLPYPSCRRQICPSHVRYRWRRLTPAWRGSSPLAAPLSRAPDPPHRSPKHSLSWGKQSCFPFASHTERHGCPATCTQPHAAGRNTCGRWRRPVCRISSSCTSSSSLASSCAPSPADPVPSSFPLSFYSLGKASSIPSPSPRHEASWEL